VEVLVLDASYGEGGGQILRAALSLAVVLRRPLTLTRIRARRRKPGLQPQHLVVVRALAALSDAEVRGDKLDSTEVRFTPRTLRAGDHRFDIGAIRGSAGSVSLLLQAVLPPLLLADGSSRLRVVGGTHVPWSPPVHYLTSVFLPALREIGPRVGLTLERFGWYPRGRGEIVVEIDPCHGYSGIRWVEPPARPAVAGVSVVSRLPGEIARRQRRRALDRLAARGLAADIEVVEDARALDPGTCLILSVSGPGAHGGSSALGRRGVRAESVADEAVEGLFGYLDGGGAVDGHLADQLVPILALAATPSSLTCPGLTDHLRSVAWVVQQLLGARIDLSDARPARVAIDPSGASPEDPALRRGPGPSP
jgi:RNA 3'-terminal phosphate cyclase (ATP)